VRNESPGRADLKKQREEREKLIQRKADLEKVNKLIA